MPDAPRPKSDRAAADELAIPSPNRDTEAAPVTNTPKGAPLTPSTAVVPPRAAASDLALPSPNRVAATKDPSAPVTPKPVGALGADDAKREAAKAAVTAAAAGTGGQLGAKGGAKAGAALGSALGPAGTVVGAKVGSVIGSRLGAKAGAATGTRLGRGIDRVHNAGAALRSVPGGWRVASRLERAVPSTQQLIAKGGSISAGIEWFARKNPLYRIISRFLPQVPWIKNSVGLGCGCASGCGGGGTCCTTCCSCFPFLLVPALMLAAALWLQGALNPFAIPAICSRTGIDCGGNGSVSFTITADDLPTGAVTAWRQVEAETGVPWFYVAAWEKVTTDFGRADLSKERANEGAKEPPAEIIALARQSLANGVTTVASSDTATDPEVVANISADLTEALETRIARLRSTLRGSSYGPMLVTGDEWFTYGNPQGQADPAATPGDGEGSISEPGAGLGILPTLSAPQLCNGRPLNPVPDPRKNPAQREAMSRVFLETIGADPNNAELVRAVEAWAQRETSWRSRPIWSGNPFSVGANGTDVECGSFNDVGIAVFPTIEIAAREAGELLLNPASPRYGYEAVVNAARAGDPIGFMIWLAASSWSGASRYGCSIGTNNLLPLYEDLGGTLPPLTEGCVTPGSTYQAELVNRVLNPYLRLDAGVIIGRHISARYGERAVAEDLEFTNASAITVTSPPLAESLAMAAYFADLQDPERNDGERLAEASGIPETFARLVGYADDPGGFLGIGGSMENARPRIDGGGPCNYQSSVGATLFCTIVGVTWPTTGPVPEILKGQPVTGPQRAYACSLIVKQAGKLYEQEPVTREEFESESCDQFAVRPQPVSFAGATSLRDALARVYIPAAESPAPGRAVLDRAALSTLMSALIADPVLLGDPSATLTVPTTTGDEVTVNLYAAAIDEYAYAVYEAYSAAEVRRGGADSPEARARAVELRFYGPLVDAALEDAGIVIDRAVPLATLVADEVMGGLGAAGGCTPYTATPIRADGTAPASDPRVASRYATLREAGEIEALLTDNGLEGALTRSVDPLLIAALAEVASGSSLSYSEGSRSGLFAFTATERKVAGLAAGASAASEIEAAIARLRDLLGVYRPLKQAVAVFRVGETRLGEAGGRIDRLPAADQAFTTAVLKRYAALIATDPTKTGLADTPVSGLVGCYRWGSGLAERYDPAISDDPAEFAIAMNLCRPERDCGNAVVRANGKAVLVRVADFYDGGIGESDAQIAALRPAVIEALALTGEGPYTVEIELVGRSALTVDLGPLGEREAATIGVDLFRAADRVLESGDPASAVRTIVFALRDSLSAQGLGANDVPDLGHYGRFLAARGACVGVSATFTEPDLFRGPDANGSRYLVELPDCPYVKTAVAAIRDFLATSSGSALTAEYGLQAVSSFGYINPIVGGWINSGFLPRFLTVNGGYVDKLRITANGKTTPVHSGVDFQIDHFSANLVVAVADGMAYWEPGYETFVSSACPGGCVRPISLLYVQGFDGTLWNYGHVIPDYFPDPALAAAYDASTAKVDGRRAVRVSQGQTLAQIASGPNHLHLAVYFPAKSLPYRYPFLGDENAVYSYAAGSALFRIDPLSVLPQTLDEYANKSARSLGEYYTKAYYPNYFPPVADPARLPGWKGIVVVGSGAGGGVVAGSTKPKGTIFGIDGGTAAWSAVRGASAYEVNAITAGETDCERAGAVKKIVPGSATSYTFTATELASVGGKALSFCVRARFKEGTTTAYEYAAVSRRISSLSAGQVVTGRPTLTWTALAGATGYRIEVATTADFSGAAVYKTTATSYTLPDRPAGTYYLRVIGTVSTSGSVYAAPPGPSVRIQIK